MGETMKITCKNAECKYYYDLKKGEHCPAEEGCPGYMTNRKKALNKIMRCKDCEYCKRIYTNAWKEYHYECVAGGRNKTIFLIDERHCDYRVR